MKKSTISATLLICACLQVTVVNHFKFFGIKPDLILVGIVIAGLFGELKFAVALGIAAGAFKDIYGSGAFAANTLLSALWVFLTANLARRISLDINLTRAALVFVIAALNAVAMRILLWCLGTQVAPGIFMRIFFLDSLYTALASLLVFKLLKIR